jgi:hypothetical protein
MSLGMVPAPGLQLHTLTLEPRLTCVADAFALPCAQRASQMRTHRNEVCFPGGKVDYDVSLLRWHMSVEVLQVVLCRCASLHLH